MAFLILELMVQFRRKPFIHLCPNAMIQSAYSLKLYSSTYKEITVNSWRGQSLNLSLERDCLFLLAHLPGEQELLGSNPSSAKNVFLAKPFQTC